MKGFITQVFFVATLILSLSNFAQSQETVDFEKYYPEVDKAYQREAKLTWWAGREDASSPPAQDYWEVVFENQAPVTTKENEFLLTGLQPNSSYTVKIRAVKGNNYSKYEEVRVITAPLSKAVDDIARIPFLRSISKYGNIGNLKRTIDLFYTDLAGDNAQITYSVDGKELQPQNNKLTLPRKGKQILKIKITEAPDRVWELDYKLDVYH